jgi:hypothetical protein
MDGGAYGQSFLPIPLSHVESGHGSHPSRYGTLRTLGMQGTGDSRLECPARHGAAQRPARHGTAPSRPPAPPAPRGATRRQLAGGRSVASHRHLYRTAVVAGHVRMGPA